MERGKRLFSRKGSGQVCEYICGGGPTHEVMGGGGGRGVARSGQGKDDRH